MRQDTQVKTKIKSDRFVDELNLYDLQKVLSNLISVILPNKLNQLSHNGFNFVHVI